MLTKAGDRLFKQLNITISSQTELQSGVKLAQAVNHIFYDSKNEAFQNRIIKQNLERKGNHIINANNILKQIKNDENIQCPEQIRKMTSFTMIQNQGELSKFVDWLAKQHQIRSSYKDVIYEESEPNEEDKHEQYHFHIQNHSQNLYEMAGGNEKQHENEFQNVFFCHKDLSPNGIETPPLNDSLDSPDKVVKKGSFKIIRPKQNFDKKQDKEVKEEKVQISKQHIFIDDMNTSEQNQPSARKTVPKIAERPPLYKKINPKQNKKTQQDSLQKRNLKQSNIYKSPAPPNSNYLSKQESPNEEENHRENVPNSYIKFKNNSLSEQIRTLDRQIQKENKQTEVNRERRNSQSNSATQRKMFKMEIPEVDDSEKRQIVMWLIDINLLNSVAASYYDRLNEICKNGVIFPEIINHQKGRGEPLCYFKKPKRSAEVHSNFQKVFTYLREIPAFQSDLLFMYEYFVPEAQENAFWNLLLSCKKCFQKPYSKITKNNQQIYTRENSIKTKMSRSHLSASRRHSQRKNTVPLNDSRKKKINETQYQKIKYGSSTEFKKGNSEQKVISRKSSLQFIQDIPERKKTMKDELIQRQEPIEHNINRNVGYKDLHQFKKHQSTQNSFMKTPQKKTNQSNNEFSMSRSKINTNSVKKIIKLDNPELPSVTLEMEMKALKFLKQKNYFVDEDGLDQKYLFQDPVRNGTLLNLIFKKQFKQEHHRFIIRPKNITDCRQNFERAFTAIKQMMIYIPKPFECHFEEIIRGEVNIFYGIIWHMVFSNRTSNGVIRGESIILSKENQFNFSRQDHNEGNPQNIILWIQRLEQHSQSIAHLQIRDINSLQAAINNSNLLFKIAEAILPEKYTIKPTYERPINHVEQESNMKKILAFLAHNRVLRSEYAWKARSIVKKDKIVLNQLLSDIMKYHLSREDPSVSTSLAKYVKIQKSYSKPIQRLDTTMNNNNSFAHQNPGYQDQIEVPTKQRQKSVEKNLVIEVDWMRKLGYMGDLSLNNGVILCRLLSQITMKSILFKQNPQSKAECLTNIRKAIRSIDRFRWDEHDVSSADEKLTYDIYKFIREKYKHSYLLKSIN